MLLQLELFFRIFLSVLCGTLIGYERAQRLKAAGIRTHILVAAASALFIIISKYGFYDILQYHNMHLDPSRVAAQVVSGISFIGAGTILIKGNNINGLTTAAGLWITSGVGMALGAGLYFIGILSTILIVIVQFFLRSDFSYLKIVKKETIRISIQAEYTSYIKQEINAYLEKHNVENIAFNIHKLNDDIVYFDITGRVKSNEYRRNAILEDIYSLGSVHAVT